MSADATFQASRSSIQHGSRVRLSPGLVALAGLFAVVMVALAGWAVSRYFDSINQLTRGPIVASLPVSIEQPGQLVVYYEGGYDRTLADLGLRVTGPDGQSVTTRSFGYDLRYDVDRLVGHAVATFEASTAGNYMVSSGLAEPGANLAVGPDLGPISLIMIALGLAAICALGVAALAATVLILARRRPA